MVRSGLEEERFVAPDAVPRVSQYRLMAHLGSAFVLYSLFLWNALEITFPAATVMANVSQATLKYRRLVLF